MFEIFSEKHTSLQVKSFFVEFSRKILQLFTSSKYIQKITKDIPKSSDTILSPEKAWSLTSLFFNWCRIFLSMHFKKGVSGCKAVIVERFCSKQELVNMSCELASDHII